MLAISSLCCTRVSALAARVRLKTGRSQMQRRPETGLKAEDPRVGARLDAQSGLVKARERPVLLNDGSRSTGRAV